MKAPAIRLRELCLAGSSDGTVPTSPEAQKAEEDTKRHQNHIRALEEMAADGIDVTDLMTKTRAEIAKLKSKLPKTHQTLENQALAFDAIKDCREKQAIQSRDLMEQQAKLEEQQQQEDDKLKTSLEEFEKRYHAQK